MDWDSFLEFVAPGLNPPYQDNVEANSAPPPAVQNPPEQAAAHNGPNLNAIPQAPVAPAAAINNVYNFNAPVQLGFQGLGEPMPLHVYVPGGYVNGGNANGGHLSPVDGNVVNHNNHFNGGNVQNNQFNGNNHHNNGFGDNNFAVHAPPPAPAPPLVPAIKFCDHPGCHNPVEDPGPRVAAGDSILIATQYQ
ncbi:hypothetical protein QBC32DRAFT_366282 [Pseudoneurospora amorphoporcata]|uniref:Uncharacterized protein n=1 Tax=Pseudoneurospora amorphoporcata TaxID=241081 RepID=A0AAN6NK76_9PEZI|nr:hypothetical protein QBC32DRAFT_366282 [Pseudoneurospora amorphoporcata]